MSHLKTPPPSPKPFQTLETRFSLKRFTLEFSIAHSYPAGTIEILSNIVPAIAAPGKPQLSRRLSFYPKEALSSADPAVQPCFQATRGSKKQARRSTAVEPVRAEVLAPTNPVNILSIWDGIQHLRRAKTWG